MLRYSAFAGSNLFVSSDLTIDRRFINGDAGNAVNVATRSMASWQVRSFGRYRLIIEIGLLSLLGRCLLTACPSESTADMLRARGIARVRIWPRGIDTKLFGPHRRSATRRALWRVERAEQAHNDGLDTKNGMAGLPTPPPSPDLLPAEEQQRRLESTVVLYVGRL